jgi:hypothetical protein
MTENKAKVEIDIKELKDFFFRASANGYASGKEPENIPIFPGAKGYFYAEWIEEKLYKYFDVYFSIGSGRSFGFTIISIDDKLVWYMRYNGACYQKFVNEQKTTDTLKRALLEAYQEKLFLGGRGVKKFKDGNFEYNNLPTKNFFEEFFGEDIIHDETQFFPQKIFYHNYEGGLIPLKE